MPSPNHKSIQDKWAHRWTGAGCFSGPDSPSGKKFYTRDAAPYPNGDLHIGHLRNYVLGDIMARYKRQCGYDVLYATNFDAFGLPNELAATKRGISPEELTDDNIEQMTATFRTLGISYDFSRLKKTSDPEYYRWTQWLFLEMHKAGLVYRSEKELPWCESCEVTLAFMQILDGECWRCGSQVTTRSMPQWSIRMTDATEELYQTISDLPHWSERSRQLMRGFIGRSEGCSVALPLTHSGRSAFSLEIFVPEHIDFGNVTFVAAAPDDPGLLALLNNSGKQPWVVSEEEYSRQVSELKDAASYKGVRRAKKGDETVRCGFDTGLRVFFPPLQAALPVWAVNYLTSDAGPPVRACAPDCDRGDKVFAQKYGIGAPEKYTSPHEAPLSVLEPVPRVYYQVRDWVISRGRRWGTPIPFIHCRDCGPIPAPASMLPITHDDQRPAQCPQCGSPGHYDPETLDCNFDDSWCFVSGPYTDSDKNPFTDENTGAWLPVDWYNSGFDIYVITHVHRFVSWFLYKQGLTPCRELIDGYHGHDLVLGTQGKISKRYANEGDLSSLLEKHGADVLRVAIAWAASPGKQIHWEAGLLQAARKLINRLSTMTRQIVEIESSRRISRTAAPVITASKRVRFSKSLEIDIQRISEFISTYRPHAAISIIERRLSILRRTMSNSFKDDAVNREDFEYIKASFKLVVQVLSPFTPFHCEESWEMLGAPPFISTTPWPDQQMTVTGAGAGISDNQGNAK